MSSAGRQFILLLWKNFVLQKRKKCVTVFEILIPVAFALLLLLIRGIAKSKYIDTDTTWDSFNPATTNAFPYPKKQLFYTPSNTATDAIMATVQTATFIDNVKSFASEDELVEAYKMNSANDLWAGVVFDGDFTTGLPAKIAYKLRVTHRNGSNDEWLTDYTFQFFQTFGPRKDKDKTGGRPFYSETGFLSLQYFIDAAIIETHHPGAGLGTDYTVELKKMAYPPYLDDVLTTVLQQNLGLPLIIMLSFMLNALQIAKNIAYEKEKKLKEAMKMMGLSTFMYWLSWFVKCLIYLVLIVIVYTIIFSIPLGSKGAIINYGQPTLYLVFLLSYVLSIVAFCFMISTFFTKANSAAFAAGVLFFLTYFPVFFLTDRYEDMSQAAKMSACLLSNVGMAFGIKVLMMYEGTGEGAQWNNFYKPATIDDNFSLLDAILMLLIDTVLYMTIAWYVDNINPGDAGIARPPWFPFLPSYWCGSKTRASDYDSDGQNINNPEYFERDPVGATVGIGIRHLRKSFGKKVAVRDFSLNMYEGQITALLGHNGAGKTTTISMLTGFLEPSSGTAMVNKYNIRTDIANVRKNLGFCPQHNILFDMMTVEEHLWFFAKLKGCPSKEVQQEVDNMITVLGLDQKRLALSQTLSGGQKRKLSVGIALIAGSKTVILDEPSSGLDPAARRQTWDILQKFREGRTIILTTHFMDEADILGDRIAIMAEGVVKCCGTSMFLKKLFGAGYHLVIVKNTTCNVDHLTQVLRSHIPSAVLASEISAEVSYLLPFDEMPKFEKLFVNIEQNMAALGINSFGTSATTMEEVFLKVGEAPDDEEVNGGPPAVKRDESINTFANQNYASTGVADGGQSPAARDSYKVPSFKKMLQEGEVNGAMNSAEETAVKMQPITNEQYISYNQGLRKNHGMDLAKQQFFSMIVKKFIHTKRNKLITFTQLALPIFFTIMALAIEKAIPAVRDEPSLPLDMAPFSSYVSTYSNGYNISNAGATDLANNYSSQFSYTEQVDRAVYPLMDKYYTHKAVDIGVSTFNLRYLVGADFQYNNSKTVVTAHFNGQPYHGVAISLHYAMNGMLKYFTDDTYDISITNAPFPRKLEDSKKSIFYSTQGTAFSIAISVMFGMAFMVTSFIIFLIKERSVGAKHLQVVSGVGPGAFWMSTFLWDMINYTLPALCILVVFAAFQTAAYSEDGHLGIVFVIFMLYGWAVLPFAYLLHYLFKVPATGMVVISMINLLTGLIFLLASYTLSIPALGIEEVGRAVEWVFIIFFPNFNLGVALMDMYTNANYIELCAPFVNKTMCSGQFPNPCCFPDHCGDFCFTYYHNFLAWEKPGIGRSITFMVLQGLVFFSIVLLGETGILRRLLNSVCSQGSATIGSMTNIHGRVSSLRLTEDSDVAQEKSRINNTPMPVLMGSDSLIIQNVSKVYGSGLRAVSNISVGVAAQECFGLLGQNGAGKTTTFKMLTGDEQVSSGKAYLNRYSVLSDIKQVQRNLGYCPQFDALIDQMTGRESLYMYARLRGIEEAQIKDVVNDIIDVMLLKKDADKHVGNYSGGNKRKLSTAIALIGDPPFIFLDEPTTGMDPGARRQLWNVLSQVRASGRTLVLTSHRMITVWLLGDNGREVCGIYAAESTMEECDALCTKIVIMVNGVFVCLGSPQHLKNKFGHGYTLSCRLGLDEAGQVASSNRLVEFVTSLWPNSEVFDANQGYVDFQIPDDNAKLAQIFGRMEEAKMKSNCYIEDYSVHQTTLEQIFLTFTQNQTAPREVPKRKCCGTVCC